MKATTVNTEIEKTATNNKYNQFNKLASYCSSNRKKQEQECELSGKASSLFSLVEVLDCLVVQEGEGEGAQSVAVVQLPLLQPLVHQVVQVRRHQGLDAAVAQSSGHAAQRLCDQDTAVRRHLVCSVQSVQCDEDTPPSPSPSPDPDPDPVPDPVTFNISFSSTLFSL